MFYMKAPPIQLVTRVRRVGNSIAVLIPAREARRAGIREGQMITATIQQEIPEPLGLLEDLYDGEFSRRKERLWRDRI